jgi:putative spermidine/putrescine transport system permease protein
VVAFACARLPYPTRFRSIYQSNIPFAAALAVFLVLVSLALIGLTLLLGQGRKPAGGR